MPERVPVKIAEWDATKKRLAGDVRAWVTPDPSPPIRSAMPSIRQFGDFLDEEISFRKRRRIGIQLALILMGNENTDPVRHPEGRDDPEEYA